MTGSVAFDTIMVFGGRFGDHILPDKTNVLNVAFLVDQLERRRGGTASNICVLDGDCSASIRCSAPRSAAVISSSYAAALEFEGVDMSAVLSCDDIGTATAFITTDLDGNQITAFHPGAMTRAAGVDLSALSDVSEVIVGADDAAAMALHVEQARSARRAADLRSGAADSGDAATTSAARSRPGVACRGQRLRVRDDSRAHRSVDRIDSARRGWWRSPAALPAARSMVTRRASSVIPAAPVSDVVDPTGAGDAYIAGLVTGFRAGASPEVAGRMGSLAAAYVVEQNGPQTHHFDPPAFRARYAAAFGSSLSLPAKTPA